MKTFVTFSCSIFLVFVRKLCFFQRFIFKKFSVCFKTFNQLMNTQIVEQFHPVETETFFLKFKKVFCFKNVLKGLAVAFFFFFKKT